MNPVRRRNVARELLRVRRTTAIIGGLLAVELVLGAFELAQYGSGTDSAHDRAVAIAVASNVVVTDLLGAETGQRGFLLTGNAAYLAPYHASSRAIPADLARLRAAGGSRTGHGASQLPALAHRKLAELARTIALVRAGHRAQALRLVDGDRGEHLMDAARSAADRAQIAAVGTARQRSAEHRVWLVQRAASAAIALVLIGLLLSAWRLRRRVVAREEDFRRVFDEAPIGMAVLPVSGAGAGRFSQVNRELMRMTGYDRAALLGMPIVDLTHPSDRQAARKNLLLFARGERGGGSAERRWLHADGSVVWVSASASVLAGSHHERTCVLQAVDITARKFAEEGLTRQAFYDPLTDLPNRILLRERLVHSLARARRTGEVVALLYVDLDNFKDINDLHGHAVGDAILVEAAQRILCCLRDSDTASRLGGDEFVIVCDGLGEASEVELDALGARISEALGRPLVAAGHDMCLEASIGVALGHGGSDPEELLRQADAAMYVAKQGGKARQAVADAATVTRANRHLNVGHELRAALERDEFRLYYQPVVDLR